jgi:hypothetical protein
MHVAGPLCPQISSQHDVMPDDVINRYSPVVDAIFADSVPTGTQQSHLLGLHHKRSIIIAAEWFRNAPEYV